MLRQVHRGIIQWQYSGLQNRPWGFESLFPCSYKKAWNIKFQAFIVSSYVICYILHIVNFHSFSPIFTYYLAEKSPRKETYLYERITSFWGCRNSYYLPLFSILCHPFCYMNDASIFIKFLYNNPLCIFSSTSLCILS